MSYTAMVGRVGHSILAAFVLAAIAAAFYPHLPQTGPFAIQPLFKQAVEFVIPTVIVGAGTVGLWLLNDSVF